MSGTILLLLLLLLNACVRVADVMIFTFVSLMPVHSFMIMYNHKRVSLKYIKCIETIKGVK